MLDLPPQSSPLEIAVVSDLTEGAKLRDCRRVRLSETEAIFNEHMDQKQWTEFGRDLAVIRDAWRFYHADWLRFGRKKFGPNVVRETVEQLGFDFDDMEKSSQIALVDPETRRKQLPAIYHEVVGFFISNGVPRPKGEGSEVEAVEFTQEDAKRWLDIAIEEELTESDLHNSITENKVIKKPVTERSKNRDGVVTIHGISTTFTRWLKNMETRGETVEKMSREDKLRIVTETDPIAALNARLKADVLKTVGAA